MPSSTDEAYRIEENENDNSPIQELKGRKKTKNKKKKSIRSQEEGGQDEGHQVATAEFL